MSSKDKKPTEDGGSNAVKLGPPFFVAFALGTVGGMAVFTLLARAGWSVLRLERWARYEGAVLGGALIVIGLLVLAHQH